MPRTRPPYAPEFRLQMVELVRRSRRGPTRGGAGETLTGWKPAPPARRPGHTSCEWSRSTSRVFSTPHT